MNVHRAPSFIPPGDTSGLEVLLKKPMPAMGPVMHPFSPMTGVGPFGMARTTELTVDPLGNIARQEGTSQLPFLLGNLSHLMIEPLSGTEEKTWTVAHGSGVVIKESGPPRFGPFFANDEGFVPAKETTTYTIESASDKVVVIRKQYEFRATAAGTEEPPFEITGDGRWTFNRAEGVSGELDFSMKVTIRTGGVGVEIPLKATYHLLDEAQQAKIAKALEGLVVKPDYFWRVLAAKALEKWSTPTKVPALLQLLVDKNVGMQESAIKALPRFKTPEAIGAIVAILAAGGGFVRGPAVEFLKAAGPAAEPAVVKLLENLEPGTRKDAAEVLKVIGTKQCIPALEKTATSDPNVFAKNAAKEALAAVKGREK